MCFRPSTWWTIGNTAPDKTLWAILFSYPDQKKRQIYLKKKQLTIFRLDTVRIIKPELLFCCRNIWLSILLGYAVVWEVSEEQHSWHFQNTTEVQRLKVQGWQFWVVLNWPSVLTFCRNNSRAKLSQTAPKECCSLPLFFHPNVLSLCIIYHNRLHNWGSWTQEQYKLNTKHALSSCSSHSPDMTSLNPQRNQLPQWLRIDAEELMFRKMLCVTEKSFFF